MKKLLVVVLSLVMVACLAACNNGKQAETQAATQETTAGSAYTYEEDKGNFKITWTLTLNDDGTYTLLEHNGLVDAEIKHTGKSYEKDGDMVALGAWDDQSADKSDFINDDGSSTWIISGSSMEPYVDPSQQSIAGTYTYEEDRGDFKVTWKVVLNKGGDYVIEETHGLSGNVTNHTGKEWKDNGDGTFTTGGWDKDENKSEFFKPNGEATWVMLGDGKVEPVVDEDAKGGSESGINPGKYSYVEEKGIGNWTWDVLLMGNGNCRIDETDKDGNVTQHEAAGWVDNGDGTVTTGEWTDKECNKSDWFKPTGEATWKINADGTCEPVTEDNGGAASAVNPGKYSYVEEKGIGNWTWEVLIMGNGNCRVDETNKDGVVTQHEAAGWIDNGDGTVTTGAWTDAESDKSDWFAADGTATWKINADGTCEPVQ